ncbi:MAG: hypothetical protein PVG65_03185 [Candidatus Thorarchaeota archaeon]|jgi:hypothetical protein
MTDKTAKKPLKKELEAMLEQSQTETTRAQQAYKSALERQKEICSERDHALASRDSALKAKEAAEKAMEEALNQANQKENNIDKVIKKKQEEVDEAIKLVAHSEVRADAAEKAVEAKNNEINTLATKLKDLENDNKFLLKQVGQQVRRPFRRALAFCAANAIIFAMIAVGVISLELSPASKKVVMEKIAKYAPMFYLAEKKPDPLQGVLFDRGMNGISIIGTPTTPYSNVTEPLCNWAEKNGFDSILFGKIRKWGGTEVLDTGSGHVPLNLILKKMRENGNVKAVSFAKNPDNITLPSPFVRTSKGNIQFWQSQKKVASFIPTFWNDEKQINFRSENFSGRIVNGKCSAKTGDGPSLEELYPVERPEVH